MVGVRPAPPTPPSLFRLFDVSAFFTSPPNPALRRFVAPWLRAFVARFLRFCVSFALSTLHPLNPSWLRGSRFCVSAFLRFPRAFVAPVSAFLFSTFLRFPLAPASPPW